MKLRERGSIFIGIDVGATKTELLATVEGADSDVSIEGPGANLQRVGLAGTARIVADLIHRAVDNIPNGTLRSVCAGIAGAGRAGDRKRLHLELARMLSSTGNGKTLQRVPIHIVHDGIIALEAAFPHGSGIVIVVGTGSVAYARTHDKVIERVGGWGYLIGDEGSGHALGLGAVKAVIDSMDGGPPTSLTAILDEAFGLSTMDILINRIYRDGWPVQQAAPHLIRAAEEGDEQAMSVIRDQTDRLARQVSWLGSRVAGRTIHRIAYLGGLARSEFYGEHLREALARHLPGWTVAQATDRPVVGALRLAHNPESDDAFERPAAGDNP